MQKYTTGEVAKICGVSVRTVQYYDRCKIVSPTEISEGGRRLYHEDDLFKLKKICYLKTLEIPLKEIKGIMNSGESDDIIFAILKEQKFNLEREIELKRKSVENIDALLQQNEKYKQGDFKAVMKDLKENAIERKKLKKIRLTMLFTAIPALLLEIGSIVLWAISGIWWPFVAVYALAIVYGIGISRYYFKSVNYVCPHCDKVFKPKFKSAFFANHTPTTRKLVCPHCNTKNFCIETARDVDE